VPNTSGMPKVRPRPVHFQPKTNPMKTKVAGFSSVLPSQNAVVAAEFCCSAWSSA